MPESRPVVLCVDDEKIVLDGLKQQLRRNLDQRYSIETVESGEEALEVLAELAEGGVHVPAIVSDHIMPAMKGAELLAQVHERYPRTIKIMLTGQADGEAVGEAVNRAALYRYIAKPWSEDDLVLTLREAIRRYFHERELDEKNRELESKHRLLERLVAGIAHEVNTPIGAMSSATQTLARGVDRVRKALEEGPEARWLAEAQKLLEVLTSGNERIADLVKRLRRFVSLDEAERKVVDLSEIADNSIAVVMAGRRDAALRIELTSTRTAARVDCHPARISQALLQLLQNAIDAQQGRGLVTVRIETAASRAVLAVEDEGCGIDAELVARLFEPGFSDRGDGRIGLGMGLSLAKRAVEESGGTLELLARAPKGTCARITLPLDPEAPVPDPK